MEGVIATQRGAIRIWDFEEGIPVRDVDTHAGEVERVHFDLSGRRVIAALADGTCSGLGTWQLTLPEKPQRSSALHRITRLRK